MDISWEVVVPRWGSLSQLTAGKLSYPPVRKEIQHRDQSYSNLGAEFL